MAETSPENMKADQLAIVKTHLTASQIPFEKYQFKDSLKHLEQALSICQALELKNDATLASVYAAMGRCYLNENKLDKALYYHRLALDIRVRLL